MQKPSKFSNLSMGKNLFQKSLFNPEILGDRFRFTKILYSTGAYNLHMALEIAERRTLIMTSHAKSTSKKNSAAYQEKIKSFSLKIVWKNTQTINGTPYKINIYEKKGISFQECLSEYLIVKSSVVIFFLVLMIQLIEKTHRSDLNFQNFDAGLFFLSKKKGIQKLQLLICDTQTFYDKSRQLESAQTNKQTTKIRENSKQKSLISPLTSFKKPSRTVDVRNILRKIQEIQSNFHIFYESPENEQKMGRLIKMINSDCRKQQNLCNGKIYQVWIQACHQAFPTLSEVQTEVIGKIKSLKQIERKNIKILSDSFQISQLQEIQQCDNIDEDLHDLNQMIQSHTMTSFFPNNKTIFAEEKADSDE